MNLHPELIAYNGNLLTQTAATNWHASALAVRDGRFVAVGADRDILALAGPNTTRIDLGGKTVTPGFCDSHIHFASFGLRRMRSADLMGSTSVGEILERLQAQADTTAGIREWIEGRGFDQEKLSDVRWPTREDLDRISTTRPILITRVCGHAAVANTVALNLLTVQERDGGDPDTGLYTENAIAPFYTRMPPVGEGEWEEAILRASTVALRTGITSVGTLLDSSVQMGGYARLRRKGKLPLRVTGMPPYTSVAALHANGIGTTFGDDWLRMGAAKLFSDGSLGARTALLDAPYADEDAPHNLGIRIYDPAHLNEMVADAQAKGFQIAIHAIGDQAVRETLDAILGALGPDGDNTFHRHRVEHASLLPPDQLARMAERKIVAVVQPQFITSDTWTGERVGPQRAHWAYPFRAMQDAGIPLALSSDCPVERLDAFACLAAAVGRHPWSPDGGLTGSEALYGYTVGSHYALHADDRIGSLEPGKLADFVTLYADPTQGSAEDIRGMKVERVFVGGEEKDI